MEARADTLSYQDAGTEDTSGCQGSFRVKHARLAYVAGLLLLLLLLLFLIATSQGTMQRNQNCNDVFQHEDRARPPAGQTWPIQ